MTTSDKVYLALTLGLSAVFIVVLSLVGAPWWVGPPLFLPAIGIGWVVKRRNDDTNRVFEATPAAYSMLPAPPPTPPPPMTPSRARFDNLVLPSADRDYRFLLHGTVVWRGTASNGVPQPEHVAVNAIQERAARLARTERAGDYDLLAPKLAAELSFPVSDLGAQLETWAAEIAVTLPEPDRERLRRLADVRKDEQVWEHERHHERSKRSYLHDDVFADTGSAVVWWLAQDVGDPGKLREGVELIGALARLTAAANNRDVDPVFRQFVDEVTTVPPITAPWQSSGPAEITDPVGLARRLIDMTMPSGTEPDRAHMADLLATLMAGLGADDAAAKIRHAFNAPDFADALEAEDAFEPEDAAGADGIPGIGDPGVDASVGSVNVKPNGSALDPTDQPQRFS